MVSQTATNMTLGDFAVALDSGEILEVKPIGTSTTNGSYVLAKLDNGRWQPILLTDAK